MSPDQYRAQAQQMAAGGDTGGALELMATAIKAHPGNAALANSAGNIAMKAADYARAAAFFASASAQQPESIEYGVNQAIALSAAGRHRQALSALEPFAQSAAQDARHCSVRAHAERGAGNLAAAAHWYDRSLTLNPGAAKAAHGRARVALERGEADAVARFERALTLNRADAEAWLGMTEALIADGEQGQARDLAEKLVEQAPQWVAALRVLAQIRLAAGEQDFASHFADAAARAPASTEIVRAHITVLEQHDLFTEALDVSTQAAQRFPDECEFLLLQASYAGIVGDHTQAEDCFAKLKLETPHRWLLEARYRLRTDDFERTARLLDQVIAANPWHISAWALRDLLWRRSGDPRSEWLHGQEGLVRMVELPDAARVLDATVPVLHRLHDGSAFPLGQSLRGGTQTRGRLLDRHEPEITLLHDALRDALEDYRHGLPSADPDHPLLRHRDAEWRITGSWSVRLSSNGDHHAAHLHPEGLISSASYFVLPRDLGQGESEMEDRAGWIELGRPAPELGIDLEPLYQLQPKLGHLALFPSTLYHGTRPFSDGQRMTVAIDVTIVE